MLFVCLLNIFTQYKHLVLFFSSAKMHLKIEGRLSTNREMHSLSVRHTWNTCQLITERPGPPDATVGTDLDPSLFIIHYTSIQSHLITIL